MIIQKIKDWFEYRKHYKQPQVRCESTKCMHNDIDNKYGFHVCTGWPISINKHGKCLDNDELTDDEFKTIFGEERK